MEKMNFAMLFGHLAVYLFVFVFAITAQGALTAWMSNYFGDDTAKNQGRISLSPFVQADLTGTIILPALAFIIGWLSPGIPFMAWGKRVPIESENWRDPKRAGVMVTLAGTFAFAAIAVISFFLLKILLVSGIIDSHELILVILKQSSVATSWLAPVELILWYSLILNVALTIFSLIPFPPFNGGVVLASLLPESFKPVVSFFEKFGILIALALIYFGIIGYVLNPIFGFVIELLGLN